MSIEAQQFEEMIRRNRELCFCGEKLKMGRNGELYCPKCKLGVKVERSEITITRGQEAMA